MTSVYPGVGLAGPSRNSRLRGQRATLLGVALLALFASIGAFGAPTARAATLTWSASDPALHKGPYLQTYVKQTPTQRSCPTPSGSSGRADNPYRDAVAFASPASPANFDAVTSLEPKDMALGQIVPFQLIVDGISAGGDPVVVNPYWLTKTTSGDDFGFDPAYGVLCAFVDYGDPGTVDPGSDAKVSAFSSSTSKGGTTNEQIDGQITLSGLQASDRAVVEIWVVLKRTITGKVTGNVQSGITDATQGSPATKLNVGNQTIPLMKVDDFSSQATDLSVTKTDTPDPATQGGNVSYKLVTTNLSTDTIASGVVVTDRLDPNTAFVSAGGAACSEASGVVTCDVGLLGPGATSTITIVTKVSATAPTANDPSTNPEAGSAGTTCPANGTDLCNRVSVTSTTADPTPANNTYVQPTNVVAPAPPVPPASSIKLTKTVAESTFTAAGSTLHYTLVAENTGQTTLSGVTISDPSLSTLTCSPAQPAVLVVAARLTCTGSYVTTQADVGNGKRDNTASVTGMPPGGPAVTATDKATVPYVAPAPRVDLQLVKTASAPQVQSGGTLGYTLTVRNGGPDTAHAVTITDPLPSSVTFVSADAGCTLTSGTVSCVVGSLAAGATATRHLTVAVNPGTGTSTGTVTPAHDLDIQKVESFQSLQGGQTADLALSCADGAVMVDAMPTVDSVDQGTGGIDKVRILASESDPQNPARYAFRVSNGTTGQAQLHLFGVCVAKQTTAADGHAHTLAFSDAIVQGGDSSPGRHDATIACPVGTAAVAPGYRFAGTTGDLVRSEGSPDGRSWSFGYVLDGQASSVELSVRCLSTTTSTAGGHTEQLALRSIDRFVTVAPADLASSQPYARERLTCPDGSKGIVGTYDLPPGVRQLGSSPQPINRDFVLLNTGAVARDVHLDLLCLGIRIGGGVRSSGAATITNRASVSSDEPDLQPSDNSSGVTVAVAAASGARVTGAATLAVGRRGAAVRVACVSRATACVGTLTVSTTTGRVVAVRHYRIRAGRAASITVPAKALTRLHRARLRVSGAQAAKTVSLTRR